MPLNAIQIEQLCDLAILLINRGEILDQYAVIVDSARRGDADAAEILVDALYFEDPRVLMQKDILRPNSSGTNISMPAVLGDPVDKFKRAMKSPLQAVVDRANEVLLPHIRSVGDFEEKVFRNLIMKTNVASGRNRFANSRLQIEVRNILAKRIAANLLEGMRTKYDWVAIPPPPSSNAFSLFVSEKMGISAEQSALWAQMPIWSQVLEELSYHILGKGVVINPEATPVENRRKAIERMKAWLADEQIKHADLRRLQKLFQQRLDNDGGEVALRAAARLKQFVLGVDFKGNFTKQHARLLVYELEFFHRRATELGGQDFIRLITPYIEQMDTKTIIEILSKSSRKGPSDEDRFLTGRAVTIAYWHSEPSKEVVDRLTSVVKHNQKQRTLRDFCRSVLAVTPEDLAAKIEKLAAAGIDVSTLTEEIRNSFADAGEDGASRPPAASNPTSTPPNLPEVPPAAPHVPPTAAGAPGSLREVAVPPCDEDPDDPQDVAASRAAPGAGRTLARPGFPAGAPRTRTVSRPQLKPAP